MSKSGKNFPDWETLYKSQEIETMPWYNDTGFLQFQKGRVEKWEITGATLRNFVKAIKLFYEMSDIPVPWKKIARGLPKIRRLVLSS